MVVSLPLTLILIVEQGWVTRYFKTSKGLLVTLKNQVQSEFIVRSHLGSES